MANPIATAKTYILANGGHAVVAASISVPTVTLIEWTNGERECTSQIAVGMAPLIGHSVPAVLGASKFP